MDIQKDLIITMAMMAGLEAVLEHHGVKKGTPEFSESVDLFAKVTGETMGKIELHKITKEIANAADRMLKDPNSCPICGCLYDDKMKGAQGRNGACECPCEHQSPDYKKTL